MLASLTAILGGSASLPASAGPPADTRPGIGKDVRITTVTLITGDRVRLIKSSNGYHATPEPASDRTGVLFGVQRRGDSVWVYPNDAVGLVAEGRLDRRLFEVTALAEAGYTDRERKTIPLIIQHSKGKPAAALPEGAARSRELTSATSTAVEQDKRTATGFWAWLTGRTKSLPGQRITTRGALSGNVRKVWLDGKVNASLDRSVPQVGAPAAWAKGYTGKGIKVAVLDTGIDANHLDLKGAITKSANFSESPDTVDRFGHGTHVASIITGDGARSGGTYQGVAPDATLLNGKVLDDGGWGTESDVIAGMEWAVANGAKVVNLSLGGPLSDGFGPMDLALDELSLSSGALFVAAAGNNGPSPGTVTTPAAATEALSVAATNRDQTAADFSSAGPRIGDNVVKPEIAAPGVDIVAARAAGTELGEPVGSHYVKLSGTSMAAPHVAGAAAILAQQQRTWNARLLKTALMGTSRLPVAEPVFRQGAGFLDASRAVTQKVFALESSVNADLRWPHTRKVEKTITYRNPGATPLKLNLSFRPVDQNGNGPAAGVFSMPNTVTVPARTTAKVTLTIDPGKAEPGTLYQGRITATATGIYVRTPVSVSIEQEAYEVALDIIDRNGDKVTGFETGQLTYPPSLLDLDRGSQIGLQPRNGTWIARVPPGAYTIALHVLTPTRNGSVSSTLYAVPAIDATAPVRLTLDARRANRATAVVDSPGARATEASTSLVQQIAGSPWWTTVVNVDPDNEPEAYVLPTATTDRPFLFRLNQALQAPGRVYELVFANRGALPADPVYPVADQELADVNVVLGAHGLGMTGRYLREMSTSSEETSLWHTHRHDVSLPTARHHLVSTSVLGEPLRWYSYLVGYAPAGESVYSEVTTPAWYQPGQSDTIRLSTAAFNPQGYGAHNNAGSMWIALRPFQSSGDGWLLFDGTPPQGSVSLERNGVEIATSSSPLSISTDRATGTATYKVVMEASRQASWSAYVPKVSGTWTFTATQPTAEEVPVPFISTRVSGAFDGWGRAPAGTVFPLTLDITGYAGDVETVTVQVSYDDGGSWVGVPVSDSTGEWIARVRHPSAGTGKWVSLRVAVTDSAGNSGDWTATRSYQIANLR